MSRNMTHPIFILFISVLFQTALFSQNGKVGIGTANPSDALHVQGDQAEHALRVQVGTATKFRVLNNGGTTIGTNNVSTTPANGLYVHGNTGLGVGNPDDRLEVNGNVDLTGALKVNGDAGQAGQVLMSNGAGGMEWGDSGFGFKHFRDFFNPDAMYTWTVPAGVSQVMFELWGAGGGGGQSGGGGAGAFVRVILDVTPGNTYNINIGDGGAGELITGTSATDGLNTTVTGPGISGTLSAGGGKAPIATGPGFGGTTSIPTGLNAQRSRGNPGWSNQVNYAEYASGSFAEIIYYGKGGAGLNFPDSGGPGDTRMRNPVTDAVIYTAGGRSGLAPGSGGGGGFSNSGADGYAIIWW